MGKKDGLDALASLMGGAGLPPGSIEQQSEDELAEQEAIVEHMNAILEFVEGRVGNNVFDMQMMLTACGNELQMQIREMVEGDDDGK